ncbi:hypothetical protein V6N11_049840 [Hibiscus sabdariffa]|uniref:CCHC-type domain-containing protein n=1 Tax=Hibiscus sabdariffa TaxID=183260 RepID=A0ABR2T8X4_9ROSI
MSEDALGLGFTETSEISAWLRLEWQAFSVNFDEQRVMKKVKIRSVVIEQHGVVSPGVLEQKPTESRSYATAVTGLSTDKPSARRLPFMDDIVVLDEYVLVDDSGPFTVIRFFDRVHDDIDQSSQNICFGCGTYGHAKELCGNPEYAGAVINNQSHCYFPLANKQVNKVSHEDLFGPWMVVEDRRRRNHRYENPGKCMTKGATGSRFDVLHDFPWEDVVVNVGITMEGVSEYHGPSVATQSPWGEHRVFKVFRLF